MYSDERQLIFDLRKLQDNAKAQDNLWNAFKVHLIPLAKKAQWAYYHFLRRSEVEEVEESFMEGYLRSWFEFYRNASIASGKSIDNIDCYEKSLFVLWHFPEYPLLTQFVAEHNILALVADRSDWMTQAMGEENQYHFRNGQLSTKLIAALKNGRPVCAMLDYHYDTSKHVWSNFMSYPARTPFGIIKLAQLHGYTIKLVSKREAELGIITQIDTSLFSLQEIIDNINHQIEKEILLHPSQWLLWPSIDRRWLNVDYES